MAIFYTGMPEKSFEDVTAKAQVGSKTGGNKAIFFDMDHDGDLDLYETRSNSNLMFRNNGDGTFQEQAEKMGLSCLNANSREAAFGDFDDDGDIDMFVVNENSSNKLFFESTAGIL